MALLVFLLVTNYRVAPYVTNIEINESKRFEDQVIFNIEIGNSFYKLNKDTWCIVTLDTKKPTNNDERWVKASQGYCSFTVKSGDYHIYVKDSYGNITDVKKQKIEINKVLDIKLNKNTIYLYKNGNEKLSYELSTIGTVNENVIWISDNESVAVVDDEGMIYAQNHGIATISAVAESGYVAKAQVIVSSFITKPVVNTNKPYITCKQFNKDEADMLDQILFDRVNAAGYGTRAGVLAAARFITLEFSYRVHYFYENGRLNNYHPYAYVDGEGRYYHRGLYLNESKFKDLSASFVGPAIWGCDLQNYTDWGPYKVGNYYPNGLDCSGFVSWALLNGGFDVGDIGAGENLEHNDLDDLGTKVAITEELMQSGRVKAGDLIGLNGHMAILAGWDDNNYYIAESLNTTGGVVMTVVPRNKLVNNSIYKYIILMDDVYKKDGNYTTMW
jgi:hypothetical protein